MKPKRWTEITGQTSRNWTAEELRRHGATMTPIEREERRHRIGRRLTCLGAVLFGISIGLAFMAFVAWKTGGGL